MIEGGEVMDLVLEIARAALGTWLGVLALYFTFHTFEVVKESNNE
jgi:hypothetical protein